MFRKTQPVLRRVGARKQSHRTESNQREASRSEASRPKANQASGSQRGWPALLCAAALTALGGAVYHGLEAQDNPSKPAPPPAAAAPSDANQQTQTHEQQDEQKKSAAADPVSNEDRKKQISDDSARLLKLATELKSEVDKTTKDTLSLGVIRKAEEIEKLAHAVKEKMKPTAGGS